MADVRPVRVGDDLYALFFSKNLSTDSVRFLTDPECSLQVGLMQRPTGHVVQPHMHPPRESVIRTTAEFLYIEQGKVKATVYDDSWNMLDEQVLTGGDFLLFLKGGHGIEVLEPTRMIEVKQGPFVGDDGAKVFRPAA
jgi:hypothetical protein